MTKPTFYVQECPTCGRRLHVRVQFLGKSVFCRHCGGSFEASDPDAGPIAMSDSAWLIARADELLASTEPTPQTAPEQRFR